MFRSPSSYWGTRFGAGALPLPASILDVRVAFTTTDIADSATMSLKEASFLRAQSPSHSRKDAFRGGTRLNVAYRRSLTERRVREWQKNSEEIGEVD